MAIRILVVDDAPFVREIIIQIALKEGWHIVGEAENGQQAVELAARTNPDIIIMDLIMPVMSGLDATKAIVSSGCKAKIIACSTVDDQNLIMRALDVGCVNYITKPFDREKVVGVIKSSHTRITDQEAQ